jgi:hypothetical protein
MRTTAISLNHECAFSKTSFIDIRYFDNLLTSNNSENACPEQNSLSGAHGRLRQP